MEYAPTEIVYRRRAGDGPIFTNNKCPNGPGLAHTCELPFGFCWTPMSSSSAEEEDTVTSSCSSGPLLCLECLAYLNLYAELVGPNRWICPFCKAENALPVHANDDSSLISPQVQYRQSTSKSTTSSTTTKTNHEETIICVMDANLPPNEAHAVSEAIQTILLKNNNSSSAAPIQLGLVVFSSTVAIHQLALAGGLASANVLVPNDEGDDEIEVPACDLYLNKIYSQADLTSFQSCISAVFPKQQGRNNKQQRQDNNNNNNNHAPLLLSRKELLKRKKEARLASGRNQPLRNAAAPVIINNAESGWTNPMKRSRPERCTAEALAVAMAISSSSSNRGSARILMFTNGCPNVGMGSIIDRTALSADVIQQVALHEAVSHFELMAKEALEEKRIGIDVFLSGAGSLGLAVYQAMVDPSGGYALPHASFESPQFDYNLNYTVTQTHVPPPDTCLVDVRLSDFMEPTHVVGAMQVVVVPRNNSSYLLPHERAAFASGASLAAKEGIATHNKPNQSVVTSTLTRFRMGRYDPLSTLSFMLKVTDSITPQDKYAFVQCTIRYLEKDGGTLVTKVSTHRLATARGVQDFLDSMDEEVVPILLAKEAVFRSIVGREDEEAIDTLVADNDRVEQLAFEAQKDLDSTIHRISGAYRLIGLEMGTSHRDFVEEGGVSSAHSSLGFAFPPELADALHRLFHLRRGSMLSPGPVRSMDDRAEIRNLFLRLPMDDCLCMMAPSLWSFGTIGESADILEPIPSDTMTLWDNRIIAADHHDGLFVWSGKATLDASFDPIREKCKKYLLERSRTRFPMPDLHMLSEGDSMSRRLTSRLAPTHADNREQQIAHFPALASLSAEELNALRDKFRFYEESTDASFRRWFWSVASASSNARNEGMSLCE